MRLLRHVTVLAAAAAIVACGSRTGLLVPPPDASILSVSGKVDLLFMIDNSGSMGDKQELLREAIPDLINRLVSPKCIDDAGNILGDSNAGNCATGHLEFKPVPDIHIAIVTSSLGGAGSDSCDPKAVNPLHPELLRHNDDQGHLINRTSQDLEEAPLPEAEPSDFLAWFPDVDANKGNPKPPVTAISDPQKLVTSFQSLVGGVGEFGCGFEAQLESWYRFLVQPDPYAEIQLTNGATTLVGVDNTILKQRHDFLRSDSLVAVIVVTDENDSHIDPQGLGGQTWAYMNSSFPNSPTAAPPRPTAACQTTPLDPACVPCTSAPNDPGCAAGEFYTVDETPLNVRMFHMRQRFGVDPQYPVQRYIDGLTSATVPNREGEHPNGSPSYVGNRNCTNPVFAMNLPTDGGQELCNLQRGPRGPDLVYFALIGGVPHQLLQVDPTNPDSPQKDVLSAADWQKILGTDALSYDFTGQDPHMLESTDPRPGLPPPSSPNNADPINGREFDTNGNFLQYACIFQLKTPHDCNDPQYAAFCDCSANLTAPPPVCDPNTPTLQVDAKAYPTIRELAVAHELGTRATVSSLCPIHITEQTPNDPLYGYRPAIGGIIDAFRAGLVH